MTVYLSIAYLLYTLQTHLHPTILLEQHLNFINSLSPFPFG